MTNWLVSVVIITRNRAQMLDQCLSALCAQDPAPHQIVVVDSSDGTDSRNVVACYSQADYIHMDNGRNCMPQSRNLGLRECTGDIVAFIDDDSIVHENWLRALHECYSDSDIGCVGGAVEEPGAQWNKDEPIGKVLSDGALSQNFSSEHTMQMLVDHVKGCNMSFRRDLLCRLGGFDPAYCGTNVREETDACLGIGKLGAKAVFCPHAVVTHLRAPRENVARDLEDPFMCWSTGHNHTYLLLKHYPRDVLKLRTNYLTGTWRRIKCLRPDSQLIARLKLLSADVRGKLSGTFAALISRRVWAAWKIRKWKP